MNIYEVHFVAKNITMDRAGHYIRIKSVHPAFSYSNAKVACTK